MSLDEITLVSGFCCIELKLYVDDTVLMVFHCSSNSIKQTLYSKGPNVDNEKYINYDS